MLKQRQVSVFLTEFMKWFDGVVLDVYPRRSINENFKIKFHDGEALVRLDEDSYGKTNNWVLLPVPEPTTSSTQVTDDNESGNDAPDL